MSYQYYTDRKKHGSKWIICKILKMYIVYTYSNFNIYFKKWSLYYNNIIKFTYKLF